MWLTFLVNATSTQLCRPFTDLSMNNCKVLNFYMDAAKSGKLGMGMVFDNRWSYQKWNETFIADQDPSIKFLELFALTFAVVGRG